MDDHHRCLLKHLLAHIDWLEKALEQLQQQIEKQLTSYQKTLDLLMSIPGLQLLSALTILSEIGDDMSRFPSAKHFARLCGSLPRQQTERRQADVGKNY